MTQNRRRIERRSLDAHVRIVDMQTDDALGVLVNIHHEGLMVMGAKSLEVDRVYQIELLPAGDAEKIGGIQIGVDCVWSTAGEESSWAGCRIIDCSEQAKNQIDNLVEEFAEKSSGENG